MEQSLNPEKVIRGYIPQVIHMSLATVADTKPWVCEVHFAYDEELNLYFSSSMNSRHGRELEQNPRVAGTIVTQHFLKQNVRCVSFEGMAERLDELDESHPGYVAYAKRLEKGSQLVRMARQEGSARLYKITVSDFYLIDGLESSPPQKFHLPWKLA